MNCPQTNSTRAMLGPIQMPGALSRSGGRHPRTWAITYRLLQWVLTESWDQEQSQGSIPDTDEECGSPKWHRIRYTKTLSLIFELSEAPLSSCFSLIGRSMFWLFCICSLWHWHTSDLLVSWGLNPPFPHINQLLYLRFYSLSSSEA